MNLILSKKYILARNRNYTIFTISDASNLCTAWGEKIKTRIQGQNIMHVCGGQHIHLKERKGELIMISWILIGANSLRNDQRFGKETFHSAITNSRTMSTVPIVSYIFFDVEPPLNVRKKTLILGTLRGGHRISATLQKRKQTCAKTSFILYMNNRNISHKQEH